MKKVLGSDVGLALDAGPGWMPKDALAFARACEPMHVTWIEDILTGDYTPYPNAELYRTSSRPRPSRSTPENRSICGR